MAVQGDIALDVDRLEHSASLSDQAYDASVTSSASTTQTSIFSDNASEQSSVASITEDDFHLSVDDRQDTYCSSTVAVSVNHQQPATKPQFQSYPTWADVTSVPSAQPQRHHPRRSSLARNQKPPPLVRQADRKLNFVDNLVESATQMVEVIWPLSIVYCKVESGVGRGVLPLRTYIEETLRRSRTSYSTLQVALYYLVLIKAHIPQREHMLDQAGDRQSVRALMCGRRMFLAALILASKYLQDRNYSAKAWSRMSGLRVVEINANERIFLEKINWKLHVAKPVFDHWTDIVLKYTPSNHPPSPSMDGTMTMLSWRALIPRLTAELSNVPLPSRCSPDHVAAATPINPLLSPVTPKPSNNHDENRERYEPASQDITPTPSMIAPPQTLEPRPTLLPPTPGLVRMGPLPTPQMTPSSVAASTPAASTCNSRRPSMCSAMSIAQRFGISRCANEEFPFPNMEKLRMTSRRQSIVSLASTRSSPESVSDLARSSRASSISSVTTMSTTSACPAPRRLNLARLATTRNCRMPMCASTESDKELDGTAARPIAIAEESDEAEPDFSISERKLHAPHRHSKHAPHTHHITPHNFNAEKSRKRHRQPRGGRRSDLYDEVRYQLEDDNDDAMVIDLVESDEDMTSPSPAPPHGLSMLSRNSSTLQAKASQPPVSLTMSPNGRVPLSRHDGSKRTCYSSDKFNTYNNPTLYMEIA